MPTTAAEKKVQLIDKIVGALEEKLPKQYRDMAVRFTRQLYARVPPEDLLGDDPEDLYGAALDFWNFARQRKAGEPSIRVFNPSLEEHGWQSTHTAVEIVTNDMPFLVDSVTMELNRHGLAVHRLIHPLMRVVRDAKGEIKDILPAEAENKGSTSEATMHLQVNRQTDPDVLETLKNDLGRVLGDVRVAVEDWQAMRSRMQEVIDGLDPKQLPLPADEVQETQEFLRWIVDNHFTFIGSRNYDLVEEKGEVLLRTVPDSGLGILRDEGSPRVSQSFAKLPPEKRKLALAPTLLVISKSEAHSTVHRPTHLDYLGIKRFDDAGKVIGEWRFLGLYTSLAYSTHPRKIPLLRKKIQVVMERSELRAEAHAGKALRNVLDTFPRDELFQAGEDELFEIAMGILHLQERQRLRLFVREDVFGRFVSCLVYVPRERHNTELRMRMQQILMQAFNGRSSEFTVQFSESVLAQVLFHIRTTPGQIPEYSRTEIEARLREAMLSWQDKLQHTLIEQCGEERGNELFQHYGEAFPAAYREDFSARIAVPDIQRLEQVSPEHPLEMHLYRPLEDPTGLLRFKVFGRDRAIPLSNALPMLEKLGLKVLGARPYELETRDRGKLWILDFDLQETPGIEVEAAEVRDIFQEAFARIWNAEMENDGFNRLVLGAHIEWRDVVMLRAYCKYLLQARIRYSQRYMEQTFTKHPHIARQLVEMFHARFDPQRRGDAEGKTAEINEAIEAALEQVSSLDEDRILRRFLSAIQATLRTNFYQTGADGEHKEYISFKLDPSRIPNMPLPLPMFEIFVFSPRTEAVHLRGGPVARGGLRWSDRLEDFRTEVLGLMKAQMVKNAVIVPVGSKGGFVVKRPPAEREALQEEVMHCYKSFIRGMLDITDNLVGGDLTPPPQVVRHDADDPYLVVAADKGTATFSDLANSVSAEYNFWLGDAFASGGSAGYDHKKMGITARGAWESVKRHFRELGVNTQTTEFTVVGIGDMSGDVFGNGMLLSRHIRLLAAFNHLHIFLDPDPDPEASFKERERLFNLPRSAWTDYDSKLISKGGGIYPRTAKSIPISPEVRKVLDIQADKLTPNELISALLKAPVDLLWNGGIGTYVKAETESHADVGDRANDAIRVNGKELHCKVIGEGGNLGFTHLGRIEFAFKGGKVLTDAIDNSGGVNCSDHEVNIKILLNQVMSAGDMTLKQRNQLLAEMTDEVADLVLRQNYLQPQAISITAAQATELLGDHIQVMRSLERAGKLDRELEFLPSDEELAERQTEHLGLVPPEMAVILAYSKISLFEELIKSNVPEDPYLKKDLLNYFPQPLRERYAGEMEKHRLRREIIGTYITNSMLNRMGSTFAFRLHEETGEDGPDIARAYTAAREMFEARQLWSAIEALDNQVAAAVQIRMHIESRRLLERASLWLLRNRRMPLAIEPTVNQFAEGISTLSLSLPNLLTGVEGEALTQTSQQFMEAGVPEELAKRVASLDALYSALDLIEVAAQADLAVEQVAAVYFGLVAHLQLGWLRESITALPVANYWQNRARAALLDGLYGHQRNLTADVLRLSPAEEAAEKRLESWLERNRSEVDRCLSMFADLRAAERPDLAMLSVALREVGGLVQGE